MSRILIVEDEKNIAEGIQINLEDKGHLTKIIGHGLKAYNEILNNEYDLIILDVMLPGMDGFEICKKIREKKIYTPILFLTVKSSEDERVYGLQIGGDDYLTKPFSLKELLARVSGILRRESWFKSGSQAPARYSFGKNEIDFESFEAKGVKGKVQLTSKECLLMKMFAENPNKVLDRATILDRVWGYNFFPSSRGVDNIIVNLRKYFEEDPSNPKYFHTVYGVGYKFTPEGENEEK